MTLRKPPVPLAECGRCSAPVVWVKLDTGSALMCNPVPVVDPRRGNVLAVLIGTGRAARLFGRVESREHPPQPRELRMTPHVATCEVVLEEREQQARAQQHPTLFDLTESETP